jgi:hypothetical protein
MQAAYGIQVGWRGDPSRQQGGYEGQGCQDIRVARGEILLAIDLIFAAWLHKVANTKICPTPNLLLLGKSAGE